MTLRSVAELYIMYKTRLGHTPPSMILFFFFFFLYLHLGKKSLFQTSHVGFFCFSLHSTFESMHCPKIYCIPLFFRTMISTFRKKQLETRNGKTNIVHHSYLQSTWFIIPNRSPSQNTIVPMKRKAPTKTRNHVVRTVGCFRSFLFPPYCFDCLWNNN